jgi:hypothetical protein
MRQEEEEIARKVKQAKLRHQNSRQQKITEPKSIQDRPKTMENIPTPSGKRPVAPGLAAMKI